MRFFGSIEKTFKDDKGFLIVCGHASTEALDSQGEIVKAGAMAGALEEYMKVGNIREMHQPSAVGKALVAQQDEKGTYIEVKVVDPHGGPEVRGGRLHGLLHRRQGHRPRPIGQEHHHRPAPHRDLPGGPAGQS